MVLFGPAAPRAKLEVLRQVVATSVGMMRLNATTSETPGDGDRRLRHASGGSKTPAAQRFPSNLVQASPSRGDGAGDMSTAAPTTHVVSTGRCIPETDLAMCANRCSYATALSDAVVGTYS